MKTFWISLTISVMMVANHVRPSQGETLPIQVVVPKYVKDGDTVILRCSYDLSSGNLGTLSWYKGSQEFYRFTASEFSPVQIFPVVGVSVDVSKSNSSFVVLRNVSLLSTARYSCWVRAKLPQGLAAIKTGWMNVVALPEQSEPQITANRRSVSSGDIFQAECTSIRSKPVATLSWLINGQPVDSQFLRPEVIIKDFNMKETVSQRIRFRVRPGHFKRGQMDLTCKAKIEPGMYNGSADIVILEKYTGDASDGETRSRGSSRNANRAESFVYKASSTAIRITLPFLDLILN